MAVAVSLPASPALAAAVTQTGRGPERGIDVSAFQNANGPIDWRELGRLGVKFVAIKVSEGTYYTNPYYRPDARAASRAGLAVLAYAFANPDQAGAAATAGFAVRAAHYRRGHGALPLVVDLENDPYSTSDCYWLGRSRMIAWITGFANRARALTGSWPIIYTTVSWWQECTGSTRRFRRDPLWLADYSRGRPALPSGWTRWSFWQYSEEGYVPGIGWTDLDYFQSASGLLSLHPASEPKPNARPKRRSKPKHQKAKKAKKPKRQHDKPKPKRKKHQKPKPKPKRKTKHKPKRKKPPRRIRKGKHLSVTNHHFHPHSHQSR
jgi:GH25 family lysozyme M1 (1,4-beta-N-acetylmuramidase)